MYWNEKEKIHTDQPTWYYSRLLVPARAVHSGTQAPSQNSRPQCSTAEFAVQKQIKCYLLWECRSGEFIEISVKSILLSIKIRCSCYKIRQISLFGVQNVQYPCSYVELTDYSKQAFYSRCVNNNNNNKKPWPRPANINRSTAPFNFDCPVTSLDYDNGDKNLHCHMHVHQSPRFYRP